MKATVTIPENKIKTKFAETILVLHNLRVSTKAWMEVGGSDPKYRMEKWQKRADELLASFILEMDESLRNIEVRKQ